MCWRVTEAIEVRKHQGRPRFSSRTHQKENDSYYQKRKMHQLFCKRAGIEPTIGHLKSDYRLGRNFYKGVFGDAINVMLSAIAYNFKRAMRVLFVLFLFLQKARSVFRNPKQSIFDGRLAYAMSFE